MGIYGEASRHGRHRAPSPVTDGVRDAPAHSLPRPTAVYCLAWHSRPDQAVVPLMTGGPNLELESVRGHRPLSSMLPWSSHPAPGCCPILLWSWQQNVIPSRWDLWLSDFRPDGVATTAVSPPESARPRRPLSCPALRCRVALREVMMLGGRGRRKKSRYSGMYALAVHGKVTTKPAGSWSQ